MRQLCCYVLIGLCCDDDVHYIMFRVKKDELKLLKEKIEKLKGVDELSAGMEAMSKCLGWVCVWQAREELEELRRGGGGEGEEGEERERVEDKVKRVQERVVAATEALERAIKEEKDQVDAMKASNESVAVRVDRSASDSQHVFLASSALSPSTSTNIKTSTISCHGSDSHFFSALWYRLLLLTRPSSTSSTRMWRRTAVASRLRSRSSRPS